VYIVSSDVDRYVAIFILNLESIFIVEVSGSETSFELFHIGVANRQTLRCYKRFLYRLKQYAFEYVFTLPVLKFVILVHTVLKCVILLHVVVCIAVRRYPGILFALYLRSNSNSDIEDRS
jgi:hypothetical protein